MAALVNTFLIILGIDLALAIVLFIAVKHRPHSVRNTIGYALRDRHQK